MPIDTDPLAIIEITRLVQPDVCPTLTAVELAEILHRNQRGTIWTASTVYPIGAKVIPTAANRNGKHYIAIEYTATGTDQKTGATEPSWSTTRDAQITDNHVVWQEDGWDWDGVLWDFTSAACQGWEEKAAKTVGRVDFETQGISVSASELHDHCLVMAKRNQRSFCL